MNKSMMFKGIALSTAIMFMGGCTGVKVNVAEFPQRMEQKAMVPDICKPIYDAPQPTIAVLDFKNNTTYTDADVVASSGQRDSAAVVGVGVAPTGVVAGGASSTKTKSRTEARTIEGKLGEAITPIIEDAVIKTGGAKLFTRGDNMDKINAELQFQDSGLVDTKTAVEFGKLSGVEYIITGTIDQAAVTRRDNSGAAEGVGKLGDATDNDTVKAIGAIFQIAAAVTDGTIVETKYTVQMLEVETGQLKYNGQFTEKVNIGKVEDPTFDHIIGAIQKGIGQGIPDLQEELNKRFGLKAYITQIRTDVEGKEAIAQINAGMNNNLKEGDVFKVIAFEEIMDPLSNEISCDMITDMVELKISNQISPTHSWAVVDGEYNTLSLGQMVQKTVSK
ncbi:MAG: CsgG/HfaB family protein [Campylobacterota bacterium]